MLSPDFWKEMRDVSEILPACTGNAAAVKALVRDQPGNYVKNLLRKVWGIRSKGGTLEMPEQAHSTTPCLRSRGPGFRSPAASSTLQVLFLTQIWSAETDMRNCEACLKGREACICSFYGCTWKHW